MTQTMDLNKMGVMPMSSAEMQDVDGGSTDFAYDVGTFFRIFGQKIMGNETGALITMAKWFSNQ